MPVITPLSCPSPVNALPSEPPFLQHFPLSVCLFPPLERAEASSYLGLSKCLARGKYSIDAYETQQQFLGKLSIHWNLCFYLYQIFYKVGHSHRQKYTDSIMIPKKKFFLATLLSWFGVVKQFKWKIQNFFLYNILNKKIQDISHHYMRARIT